MTSTRLLFATTALLLAAPLAALAESSSGDPGASAPGQGGRQHRGPPPEAIAACAGKTVGTQAGFTDRSGRTVSGACTQMGDVVAVPPPARAHGGQDGPPPQRQ